jgi:hypothetical protein
MTNGAIDVVVLPKNIGITVIDTDLKEQYTIERRGDENLITKHMLLTQEYDDVVHWQADIYTAGRRTTAKCPT